MSLRADFFGELQNDRPLYGVHRQINVPPLAEGELGRVVSRPAALLRPLRDRSSWRRHRQAHGRGIAQGCGCVAASFLPPRRHVVSDVPARRRRASPAGAIDRSRPRAKGTCRCVRGWHPNAEEQTSPHLDLEACDSARGRRADAAPRPSFGVLGDGVAARLRPCRPSLPSTRDSYAESGETFAEVAHEAIFRRWDKLREWIAAEREFLVWRSGLEAAPYPGRPRRTHRNMTRC